MPHFPYVLPRLQKGMPEATAAGAWLPVESLDVLANNLEIGDSDLSRDDIKSIPDPWAQLLVFDRALFDASHPLHKAVVVQWRALLATIALQPEFRASYTLSAESYDLEAAKSASALARTLLSLKPSRTLAPDPDLDWKTSTTLRLHARTGANLFDLGDGLPIGFLTPSALVAAGRGSENVKVAGVPWLEQGFTDPLQTPLSQRHFRVLTDFLIKLWQGLRGRPDLDVELKAGLAVALREYVEATQVKAGEADHPLVESTVEVQWPTALHRQVMGTSKAYDEGANETSQGALRMSGPLAGLFKGVILVDAELATTLAKGPESVSIWKNHSLASALLPTTFDQIRKEAEAEGYLLIRPQDLFTDALITFDSQTVNEAHPPAFQSALLPLSPLALMLAPRLRLAELLDMTVTNNAAAVRLKLDLASGQTHTVRCEIPRAVQGENALVPPDDLALWPNFRAPDWKWTFLHYTAVRGAHMRPRFAVTADFIASHIKGAAADGTDRAHQMRRWADSGQLAIDGLFGGPDANAPGEPPRMSEIKGENGELLLSRIGIQATTTAVSELHHLPGGADAVFFSRKDGGDKEVPAGMALIKFRDVNSSALEAKVAVDFGTTNTVVYTEVNGKAAPMSFADRIVFPFIVRAKSGQRRDDLAMQYLDFFPLRQHDTPLPTVAKLPVYRPGLSGDLSRQMSQGLVEEHGFSDNILFVPDFDDFVPRQRKLGVSNNILKELTEKGLLKFRLKWGETGLERSYAAHFLRQIMMMTAAELLDQGISPQSIKWRFSYPQAFRPRDKNELEKEVRTGHRQLFGPVLVADGAKERPFLCKTEGEAAAHYFMQKAPERVMLMLDIGGGTTDVALWCDGQPIWRNSFRIAGGHFFTTYLANNPEVLSRIKMDEVADGLRDVGALSDESRKDFVELYVNKPSFSKQFSAGFNRMGQDPAGKGLRFTASVALGGLMYYVGLLLTRFLPPADGSVDTRADDLPKLSNEDLSRITIAFAGRGSTFFRELHGSGGDSELDQLVKLVIAGANRNPDDAKIEIRFSGQDEAKHEVAKGLLDDRGSMGPSKESRMAVLGEDLVVTNGGAEAKLDGASDLSKLQAGSTIKSVELSHLERFLTALHHETQIDVDVHTHRGLDEIRKEVRQELVTAAKKLDEESFSNPDTQPFDPPFIMALRQLVAMMARPLAERDKVLQVDED